jgi:hypothetical protein
VSSDDAVVNGHATAELSGPILVGDQASANAVGPTFDNRTRNPPRSGSIGA